MKALLTGVSCSMLVTIFSCSKSPNQQPEPTEQLYLRTNTGNVTLNSFPGSADTLSIESNTTWFVNITGSAGSWLQASANSSHNNSKITLSTLTENTSATERIAILRIIPRDTSKVLPVTITVVQKAFGVNIAWSKLFGTSRLDELRAAVKSGDGGIVAAGMSRVSAVSANLWLVKTDDGGNTVWTKQYGGSGSDVANCIAATTDGGYIAGGHATSTDGDLTGLTTTNGDVWIVKVDASGNKLWSKTFGGSDFEEATGIVQTPDGGYVFCATTKSTDKDITFSKGGKDVWIVKLNSAGEVVWKRTLGGSNDDVATGLIKDGDGNLIVCATTKSVNGDVTNYNGGISDGWVVKLDGAGNSIWSKTLGSIYADEANAITLLPSGDFAIAGNTFSYMPGWRFNGDYMMVKLNRNGAIIQERAIGSYGLDKAYGITATPDGGIILTGYVTEVGGDVSSPQYGVNDIWTVKLDASANKVWDKTFGGTNNDRGLGIIAQSSNSFVVVG
jgi:hypothetical protein